MRFFICSIFTVFLIQCSSSSGPDWEYDFRKQTQLDTTVWTPEITMSGEGNFEFEAYLNGLQTISFDSSNGLSLKAGLMTDYQLRAGQTFGDGSNSINVGSSPTWEAILGGGRSSLTENNLGTTGRPNWAFNLASTCTDDGTAYSFPYGCGQTSAEAGGGIGASVPTAPLTPGVSNIQWNPSTPSPA